MRHDSIILKWELGYPAQDGSGSLKWTTAGVPGAVQLDVANAEGYGPHFYAENWRDYLWMEDSSFIYHCSFYQPEMKVGERLFFISKGIDYAFEVSFNGIEIHKQEGMFTPVQLDLTDYLAEKNELFVKIFPVPKKQAGPVGHRQAAASVKPAVSYGWDWHPRLIPSGIWDETCLEIRPGSHIEDVSLLYTLNDSLTAAGVLVDISGREIGSLQTILQASGCR